MITISDSFSSRLGEKPVTTNHQIRDDTINFLLYLQKYQLSYYLL